MRVRLKGVNSRRKCLADGSFRTYYWAWKGGPPLRGEPGTREFIASYNEAVAQKVAPRTGVLLAINDCAENQAGENGESVARSVGRGGRIRTSAWRNQNPLISFLKSTRIPKKLRNSIRYRSIGYRSGRNGFCLAMVATVELLAPCSSAA